MYASLNKKSPHQGSFISIVRDLVSPVSMTAVPLTVANIPAVVKSFIYHPDLTVALQFQPVDLPAFFPGAQETVALHIADLRLVFKSDTLYLRIPFTFSK